MRSLTPVMLMICLIGAAGSVHAQNPVRINLGTVAPKDSLWHQVLQKMSQDMQKASDGSVVIKIYESGRQGDENEMIRRVRQGTTLSAARPYCFSGPKV